MIQSGALPICDINNLPYTLHRLSSVEVGTHHVCDISEITRLLTVTIDYRPFVLEQSPDKTRDDSGVLGTWILAGPKHVEVSERHGLQTINSGKYLAIV